MIRVMQKSDLLCISVIHQKNFIRQNSSYKWIECAYNAYPKNICFVMLQDQQLIGYIIWAQKSGFRPEAVVELEQIAILPDFQSQGYGSELITDSLKMLRAQLNKQGSKIKHVIVTTRIDNAAQNIYKKCLNAEIEATLNNLYSADEVVMIARNI